MNRHRMVWLLGFVLLGIALASGQANGQQSVVVETPPPIASSAQPSVDLSGVWKGGWVSCRSGHQGRLSATFCRIDACHVRARFRGTFAKILPFRYPATLKIIEERDGRMRLSGSQRLGPLMGNFEYEITISNNRFEAVYRSRKDCGRWTLEKCGCNQ